MFCAIVIHMDRITWAKQDHDKVALTVEILRTETILFMSVEPRGVTEEVEDFKVTIIGQKDGEPVADEKIVGRGSEFFMICQMAVEGDNIGKAASNLIYFFTGDLSEC